MPPTKKGLSEKEWYVAEQLGRISSDLTALKQDIQELKDAISPLRRKVYYLSGAISAVGLIVSLVVNVIAKNI